MGTLTSTVGWAVGGLLQRDGFSSADDDISDLGALTASQPWIYNQIGGNLTGLLVIAFALGLWRSLSPDLLGRIGAGALVVAGLGAFIDGFFRLDCQGIDVGCENDSWHADAHRIEGRFTTAGIIAAPIILAFAFRRLPDWRDTWIPTLAAIPASLAAGVVFSTLGDGASVRPTTLTWFLWLAFVAFQLLRKRKRPASRPRRLKPTFSSPSAAGESMGAMRKRNGGSDALGAVDVAAPQNTQPSWGREALRVRQGKSWCPSPKPAPWELVGWR